MTQLQTSKRAKHSKKLALAIVFFFILHTISIWYSLFHVLLFDLNIVYFFLIQFNPKQNNCLAHKKKKSYWLCWINCTCMLLIVPHHSCFAVFSTRYIYFQSGKPSRPFYQQNAFVPTEEWPDTEWWLKPGNGPGGRLTIRFSQHSNYLVSLLVFGGHSCSWFFFFPFEGENWGNLSTEKMMGQYSSFNCEAPFSKCWGTCSK